MCMYDLERFGGGVVVDLLKTHPKLLLGGVLIDNPHALTPDEYEGSGMTVRPFGLPGVTIQPGDHVCGLYFGVHGARRSVVAIPTSRSRRGNNASASSIRLRPHTCWRTFGAKPNIDNYVECEQLQVNRADDSYLPGDRSRRSRTCSTTWSRS